MSSSINYLYYLVHVVYLKITASKGLQKQKKPLK